MKDLPAPKVSVRDLVLDEIRAGNHQLNHVQVPERKCIFLLMHHFPLHFDTFFSIVYHVFHLRVISGAFI